MKTEPRYHTLRDRIENEVFPRMTNEDARAEMLSVLEDTRYTLPVEAFKKELAEDKHLQNLIILKDEFAVFRGSWNNMISWFRQVLDSKPYQFKRFRNIAVDYARVLKLQEYELEQREKNPEFNLASLLDE